MKDEQSKHPRAAALKYDGKSAPTLVAKGSGLIAQQIIESAKEHDVHIHNDPLLLEVLGRLELGDEIPESLYLAVAKVIAFAYFLQGKHPDSSANKQEKAEPSQVHLDASSNSDRLEE